MFSPIGLIPKLSRFLGWVLVPCLLAFLGLTSCGHSADASEEARVRLAFESCKSALLARQTDQVMIYMPKNVYGYLDQLKAPLPKIPPPPPAKNTAANDSPVVTLLLRTALTKKVPADLRPNLTLDTLMQRISDQRLLNLRSVEQTTLGTITVTGDRASGEIYYQGALTALRLPFLKEDGQWKINILAILPYAEILMRLDRAMTGQTEQQQVTQIVDKLPSL